MSAALARLGWWLTAAAGPADPAEEARLLARARRGDPSAFDEIVRRHQSRVYNLAYRMLRRTEDAEDVTQEAFLRAFEALPGLRADAALGAWICRIAANLCLTRLRRTARVVEVPLDTEMAEPSDETTQDTAVRVRAALARLAPDYRAALVAFHLEGRSYEEAARVIGVGVRTLKTRLYRGRKRLRVLLQEETEL